MLLAFARVPGQIWSFWELVGVASMGGRGVCVGVVLWGGVVFGGCGVRVGVAPDALALTVSSLLLPQL